ncbi:MAG: zinc-dependent metalloprotease [Bdellovibrionales bacterium]|nr:zinc-dependent metalloprotease [Bdellovibrionales bacterium]
MAMERNRPVTLVVTLATIVALGACSKRSVEPVPTNVRVAPDSPITPPTPAETAPVGNSLAQINESIPATQNRVWLKKEFWSDRDIFLSVGVERASMTGLALSVVGYVPVKILKVGDRLVLQKNPKGLFGGTTLAPELGLNSYPILSESSTEMLVDFAAPQTPYGIATSQIAVDDDSSTEASPRFEYLKSVDVQADSLSFTNVVTLKTAKPFYSATDGSAEAQTHQDPYLLSLTLRTDWVLPPTSPNFVTLVAEAGRLGSFLTSPFVINGGNETESYVERIDTSKPFVWEVSANTPAEYYPSVEAGLLAWNKALGQDVLVVRKADGTRSFTDPRTSNLIWDDNLAIGKAFANWRSNPYTGEIVQAQIYMSGDMWVQQGALTYRLREIEKTVRALMTPAPAPQPAPAPAPAPTPADPNAPTTAQIAQELRSLSRKVDQLTANSQSPRYFIALSPDMAREKAQSGAWCDRSIDAKALKTQVLALQAMNSVNAGALQGTTLNVLDAEAHMPYPKEGVSSKDFQNNVVRAVVMHEAGHTMGLRHNFAGSTGTSLNGTVRSAAIMDYNDLVIDAEFPEPGDADKAFIASAYLGTKLPEGLRFCTDEDAMAGKPYCNLSDAFADPVKFYTVKEETFLMIGLRFAQMGSVDAALSMLMNGVDSLLQHAKLVMYPSFQGSMDTGDAQFATRQQEAWDDLQRSSQMFGLQWPAEIQSEYYEMPLKALAEAASPQAAQSNLFPQIVAIFAKALTDTDEKYSVDTRKSALTAMKKLRAPEARLALRQSEQALTAHLATLAPDALDNRAMEDEDVLKSIQKVLTDGYFANSN